jgi:hypothetical protein
MSLFGEWPTKFVYPQMMLSETVLEQEHDLSNAADHHPLQSAG